MEIEVPFGFKENLRVFLQRCGYHSSSDFNSSQASYIKRLSRDFYPRFHLYIKEYDGKSVINIHLDQKKPSYAGAHAHSGEYEGELVEREAKLISGLIKNQMDNQQSQAANSPDKKGFFSKLFG